jgi:hypothetical protein
MLARRPLPGNSLPTAVSGLDDLGNVKEQDGMMESPAMSGGDLNGLCECARVTTFYEFVALSFSGTLSQINTPRKESQSFIWFEIALRKRQSI